MSLMDKMLKATKNNLASVLTKSSFFDKKDLIQTAIPAMNVALSGELDGGLTPGLTVLAGPSRHFKSNMGLCMVAAYMKKYPDAVCLFYDSEFGSTPDYFRSFGIDGDRVLHVPIEHIEQLKFDVVQRMEQVVKGDKVIVFIDSVGNLASKKEAQDALDGKAAADMTRAKEIKSLFRIMTPHLTLKDIPCVTIAHTYKTMEMYAKDVVSGGTGIMYSANTVFIIGRQQEKDGTELAGYNFILNVDKSRFVKEKSKIPINVTFAGGVNKWSGLLDMALESGHVVKPSNGWYSRVDTETGEIEEKRFREAQTNSSEFWLQVLADKSFREMVKERYKLGTHQMLEEDKATDVCENDTEELDTFRVNLV